MKTIGLIGGITWYSTLDYYRLLNEGVNKRLGGVHSAMILIDSLEFGEIKKLTEQLDWDGLAAIMCRSAKKLEIAGANCLLIGANTMHHIADQVQDAVSIPVIHVAEAVASAIQQKQLKKVLLLGTKYTMQLEFYKKRLLRYGIVVCIPGPEDIEYINNSIYGEFSKGIFLQDTKTRYLSIIDAGVKQGAEGVIFGCTEIPILLKPEDVKVPVFDSALLHAEAAVGFALG